MLRTLIAVTALGLAAAAAVPSPAHAVDEQDFQARTTAQLVALCSTPRTDPAYAQSMQFCYGFTTGALSYRRAVTPPGAPPQYCGLPANRQEAVDRFVSWAQANPRFANDNPANTLFRFLDANYACR